MKTNFALDSSDARSGPDALTVQMHEAYARGKSPSGPLAKSGGSFRWAALPAILTGSSKIRRLRL